MDAKTVIGTLLRDGFILVFNQYKLDVVKTAEALLGAGVNNMEVTCRIEKPLAKVERVCSALPNFVVGVASLIDSPAMLAVYNAAHSEDPLPTVEQAAEAGAHFLVSAGNFRTETYEKFRGKVPMVPGCATPTEIIEQYSLGANLVKVFPAKQVGGAAFIKAIDPAIHKMISLVPMGGTSPGNMRDYIEAGVLVVGGSFSAIEKAKLETIVEEQNYKMLGHELARIKQLVDELRAEKWPGVDFGDASVETISRGTGRNFNLC